MYSYFDLPKPRTRGTGMKNDSFLKMSFLSVFFLVSCGTPIGPTTPTPESLTAPPSPPPLQETDVGSGGDGVKITFAKAKFLAAEMVRAYVPIKGVTRPELDKLISQNGSLAEDILNSAHRWTSKILEHDAMTRRIAAYPILFSFPLCRRYYDTQDAAVELLVHECCHHLGIIDEAVADAIAIAIIKSFRSRFPLNPGVARTKGIAYFPDVMNFSDMRDPDDGNFSGPVTNGAFGGDKLFLWSGLQPQGLLYDPVLDTWQKASPVNQPITHRKAFIGWMENEFVVWDAGHATGGGLYNPKTNRWRKISYEKSEGHYPLTFGNKLILLGTTSNGSEEPDTRFSLFGSIFDAKDTQWKTIPPLKETFCREIAETAVSGEPDGKSLLVVFCHEMHGSVWNRTLRSYLFDLKINKWVEESKDCKKKGAICNYLKWWSFGTPSVTKTENGFFIRAYGKIKDSTQEYRAALFDFTKMGWTEIFIDRYGPLHSSKSYKAVWDGKRVLLFGGGNEGFPIHKYDPSSGKWEIMSLPDAKMSFRSSKNIFWTGESMLVVENLEGGFETGVMIEPNP
jgi:hypothetical protein